jgi:hypothetical protein
MKFFLFIVNWKDDERCGGENEDGFEVEGLEMTEK